MSFDFLRALWPASPGTFGEFRFIRNGVVRQLWLVHPDPLDWSIIEQGDQEGWDCYFGVLPRTRDEGTAEACMPTTSVLWADLDNKHLEGGHLASFLALHKAGLEPSILVDSGNGLHSYWLLDRPVAFSAASAAMQGLHKQIGSDHVHDAPRVLRLPGTRNHKKCIECWVRDPGTMRLEACKPVRLLSLDPTLRYRWADFVDYIPDPEPRRPVTGYEEGKQDYQELPPWLREKIEKGAPQGERSEAIFDVVLNLLRRGWDDDEIEALFQGTAIGEKVQAMTEKEAARYMRRTIQKARELDG